MLGYYVQESKMREFIISSTHIMHSFSATSLIPFDFIIPKLHMKSPDEGFSTSFD